MNKRLGTLIAGLCLVAAAEVAMAAVPSPAPRPKPVPCPVWKRCPPPPNTDCPPVGRPCRLDKSLSGMSTR